MGEARALVAEAFDRAKRSGKTNWYQMTTAVLKNRLLQLTDGAFAVERYGASTVAEFAHMLPDLVTVIPSERGPAIIELLGGADDAATGRDSPVGELAERTQVREDLWRAFMDWDERHVYVVDPITGRARRRLPEDPVHLQELGRITREMYIEWRSAFIQGALAGELTPDERQRLEVWRDVPGPSRDLPRHLQDEWMSQLRTHVARHIREWFDATGNVPPPDLTTVKTAPSRPPAPAPLEAALSARSLRDLINKCVSVMTYDELCALKLPADVVARALWR
jgi:hypothetical protein